MNDSHRPWISSRGPATKRYDAAEVTRRLETSKTDVPGRIRQWRKLAGSAMPDSLFEEYDNTRKVRHEIVHKGRRLTHKDRADAQGMVDTGRWLYNQIEGKSGRARARPRPPRSRDVPRHPVTWSPVRRRAQDVRSVSDDTSRSPSWVLWRPASSAARRACPAQMASTSFLCWAKISPCSWGKAPVSVMNR
jgi:hypothetical protein